MSVATITPHPRLAMVASEARQEARARKRDRSTFLKVARSIAILLALAFAVIGLGAGTAQAWPWTKMEEDITAFVTNFCGPEDVPAPSTHTGIDNQLGLNRGESDLRGTVMPDTAGLGAEPINGLERIQAAYEGKDKVISPTYERYGFNTLSWDSFGAGCFSMGYWFTPISNALFQAVVVFPTMVAMATLNFALGNILYTVFAGVIAPFVSIFTLIFKGWALWLAPIGIIWAFIRYKGDLRGVAKTGAWMLMIFGIFIWMSNNTSTLVTKANNFVTEFASSAASQINELNGVTTGEGGTAADSINQALWYGVPYQTWLEGQVGPQTAASDRNAVENGEVSWGAVILNSKYAADDEQGRALRQDINTWNSLSYSPNESLADEAFGDMKTKPGAWTKNKMWEKIPYLFNVKAMCGDTSNGTVFTSSSAEEDNKWFYGGVCDSASAGTGNMVPHFTGQEYNARFATAFAGGFAALAVCVAVAGASIYLGVQKMLFYFLVLFGPVFLTIAMFGDEKRAAFAKRYGELMIGNLIKQGVAVLVVLFVGNAMSMLLYPPADEQFNALRNIPWLLKPTLALFFLLGLAMFLMPLKRIVTGAVKGDTKVVDKTARAPVDAAKTGAKAGAVVVGGAAAVAAVAATGGAAAPVVAKAGGMAMSAGRMAGGRGGVGKALTGIGRGANLASRAGGSLAEQKNKKQALSNLAQGVFSRDANSQQEMSKIPGAVKDGKLTPKGQAVMSKAIKKTGKDGEKQARAEALQKSYMDKFYKGHRDQKGEHHALDPNNPSNLRAAAVQKEQDRQSVREEAKHGSSRSRNTGPRPNDPNNTTNGVPDPNADNTQGGGSDQGGNNEQGRPASGARFVVGSDGQADFADRARENVSGPGFAQDQTVKANVSVEGSQIVEQMGMSYREVSQSPESLISGSVYDGGDTSKMDPRHPATSSMNDLKFAMMTGTTQEVDQATARASDAVSQHGVPGQVTSVSAVEPTTEGMASAIGAMPTISDETPWQTRSEGATAMQAAMSFVAEDSPMHEPMANYVQALSDPSVSATAVNGLKSVVIETAAPDIGADMPRADMGEAIRDSAQEVSAAPIATVAAQGALFGEPTPQMQDGPAPEGSHPFADGDPAPAPVAGYGPPPASFTGGDPTPAPAAGEGAPAPSFTGVDPAPQSQSTLFGGDAPTAYGALGGGSEGPVHASTLAANDLFGNAYYDLPPEAVDAMPPPPPQARHDDARPEVLDQYRAEIESWRADYNILPPSGQGSAPVPHPHREEAAPPVGDTPPVHPSGGDQDDPGRDGPSLFGDIAGGVAGTFGGRGGGTDAPPDDLEEVSGIPTDEHDDNSVPYRRSRRRRISGLYDMEDEDDESDNGGSISDPKGGE